MRGQFPNKELPGYGLSPSVPGDYTLIAEPADPAGEPVRSRHDAKIVPAMMFVMTT